MSTSPKTALWPCSSSTNVGLVQNLHKAGAVRSPAVLNAMKRTDRALFIPPSLRHDAYQDSPCPIGFNQTISAPHMHAQILELAHFTFTDVVKPRVLDIGAGSGYLTAALARLVEDTNGRVFGLEIIPELTQTARKNVLTAAPDLMKNDVLSLHCTNGFHGLPGEGPFHFIFVGAAVSTPPPTLLDQLADGGQLLVPVDEPRGGQMLVGVTRIGVSFVQRKLVPACFVPLVHCESPKKHRGISKSGDTEQLGPKVLHTTRSFRTLR